ncbi:MAG: putative sulfate exporter family transporter [Patescibacteria group bacterium]
MMNNKILRFLPGLIFSVIIGSAAYYLSQFHILFDPLVNGILLGLLVRLIIGARPLFSPGLGLTPRLIIPVGIVLYGVNLEFQKLSKVMPMAWLQMLVGIVIIFWLADFLGRWLKVSEKTGVLTAIGTAICGASAVMMAGPAIKAEKKDVSKAILVVVFWGIIGAFLYPFVQKFLAMPEDIYALFAATTLHTTGTVKTAVLFLGKNIEAFALSIKLARTALIIPILAVLVFIFRKEQQQSEENQSPFLIYWALAGFVITGILFSFVPELTAYAKTLKPYSAILWTLAMASIGLTIDIKGLLKDLFRPLILGLLIWLGAIAVFILGYWLIIA